MATIVELTQAAYDALGTKDPNTLYVITDAPPVPGPQGPTGAQGVPGATGPSGPGGPAGPQGPAGSNGSVGTQGVKGDKGDAGPPGAAGPAGAKGDKGDAGDRGLTGPDGARGQDGAVGPQGVPGGAGPKGDKGDAGTQGAPGLQGPAGAKGDTGSQGPAGAKGDTGASGGVGVPGPAGSQGQAGPKGDQGDAGPTGGVGPIGPGGPKGDQGATGPAGPGIATGGATGQLLAKVSAADYVTTWVDPPSGGTATDMTAATAAAIDALTIPGNYLVKGEQLVGLPDPNLTGVTGYTGFLEVRRGVAAGQTKCSQRWTVSSADPVKGGVSIWERFDMGYGWGLWTPVANGLAITQNVADANAATLSGIYNTDQSCANMPAVLAAGKRAGVLVVESRHRVGMAAGQSGNYVWVLQRWYAQGGPPMWARVLRIGTAGELTSLGDWVPQYIPQGGAAGQVLAKASAAAGDVAWIDQTGGSGAGTQGPPGRPVNTRLVAPYVSVLEAANMSAGKIRFTIGLRKVAMARVDGNGVDQSAVLGALASDDFLMVSWPTGWHIQQRNGLGGTNDATAYYWDMAAEYIGDPLPTVPDLPMVVTWYSASSAGPTGAKGATGATGATGAAGAPGAPGATGAAGPGVPVGGTTGQVLSKLNSTDFNTAWITPSGGAGSNGRGFACAPGKWGVAYEHSYGAASTTNLSTNNIILSRLRFDVAIQKIGFKTTTAPGAGAIARLVVYDDTGYPIPGVLLYSSPDILPVSVNTYYATVSLPPAYYWVGIHNIGSTSLSIRPGGGTNPWSPGAQGAYDPAAGGYGAISLSLGGTVSTTPFPAGASDAQAPWFPLQAAP